MLTRPQLAEIYPAIMVFGFIVDWITWLRSTNIRRLNNDGADHC